MREFIKGMAPHFLVSLVRWRRDVWQDARLRLLIEVGKIPSHSIRDFVYRKVGITLPRTSSIHFRAEFYRPEAIIIGEYCTIGDTCFLDGRESITIGDSVNIGSHVSIYTRQHDVDSSDFAESGGPVRIGRYAWLGSHCVVLPEVTIGEGAVVAAGAVVTRDVAPYAMVAGVPARFVRERSHDLRYRLGYRKRFV
jgi:putative colanic acid biosynthesis acetyltransferase WcaF